MKKMSILKSSVIMIAGLLSLSTAISAEKEAAPAKKVIHGEYQDWRLISVSHRNDKKTLRAILGNDKAIEAVRKDTLKAWPDGAVIAKVVWQESTHPNWADAVVPGDFAAAEAMIKDSKKFAKTGGWGFGFWKDGKLEMHPEEKSATCFACHTVVKDHDYVFTAPALK